LVKRRRVDRFPRGRLPRSLPAARHGLAVTGRLLGQRVNLRFLGALAPMSRVVDGMVRHSPYGGTRVLYADAAGLRLDGFETAAQPYGPEHAYRSSRVRTIETRIDPATPIPFEKNKNILQANLAWPRWFRNWQSSRSRHAGSVALCSSPLHFAVQDEQRRRSATERAMRGLVAGGAEVRTGGD
jgi:hypothetical protein